MTGPNVYTRDQLAQLLGQPFRELTQTKMKTAARRKITATYMPVHNGYAYRCGCKAVLSGTGGSYILRPCGAHRDLA